VATSATQSQLTWIVDCYSVVLACLLLPAGAIGDRYGRRGAFLFGLASFAIASLASTVFTSPLQLIAARGVAGAGAAFIMPATLSLLTATHRDDERMKAVGIWAGVAGSGAVIGMLGSGTLLHFWSWRSIFWAFAGFAALIFVLACTVKSSRDEEATPLDWVGAGLIAGAVAVLAGSILAARYTHVIAPHLAAFPAPLRAPASHSLAQALEVSKTIGPQGAQLAELSQTAFLRAMESSLLVMGVIIAVSAVVTGAWAPGRDGQQLRLVRRITSLRRGDAAGRHRV
jgi:MFS family permease